eukprot:352288-Chlamydomonas_euryale.AAC.2
MRACMQACKHAHAGVDQLSEEASDPGRPLPSTPSLPPHPCPLSCSHCQPVCRLAAQVLGLGIIAGACVTKVPQIRVIAAGRSAAGLSALAFELEAVGLLIISA